MITYEKAYKIAKSLKPNADACVEYENAYMFKTKADEWSIGEDGACVILKKNGKAISQTLYFDKYGSDFVREFDL